MISRTQRFPNPAHQLGFSIVELMVAILIGLIILGGVVQVMVTSKHTFLGQEDMSYIQENARYAVDVIGRDIQGAGYWGCASGDARHALVGDVNTAASAFLGVGAVQGFSSANAPEVYRGDLRELETGISSESILVRSLKGPGVPLISHSNITITLPGDHGFTEGQYLGVVGEDCRRLGVFRVSAPPAGNTVTANSANIKPRLDRSCVGADCAGYNQPYLVGALVKPYAAHAYYIGDSQFVTGEPALKRRVLSGNTAIEEEIAVGVEDLFLRYGIRENNSVRYKPVGDVTAAEWSNVVAVEVNLLLRSATASLSRPETKGIPGSERQYTDRRMRQVVTSTFRIRNRI